MSEDLETSDVGRRFRYLRGGALVAVVLAVAVEALVVFLILLST